MTTISMTAVSGSNTTLSQLATDVLANTLNDPTNTYFTDAQVTQWLNDAIRAYSAQLPRVLTTTITTVAGTDLYGLPANFRHMLKVEYPTGEDVPELLTQRPHSEPQFYASETSYDILPKGDQTAVSQLYISAAPSSGQTITITYQADHDFELTDDDPITVPEKHHHILKKYVFWQATLKLQNDEQIDPTSNSSLLMSILAQNAGQLRRDFEAALKTAVSQQKTQSGIVTWGRNNHEILGSIY